MNLLDVEIPWECSRSVRAALEALGRTEDVCFAPSGRRLAFAGFARNRIGIADVEIEPNPSKQRVLVSAVSEFTSTFLQGPHGVDFLDETTIVVGNRFGTVVAFHVPPHDVHQPRALEPIELAPGQGFESVHSPGSLRVARDAHGAAEILLCNNLSHVVTRHRVDNAAGDGFAIGASEVVLRRWLVTPDGVAVSREGWVAVSNHDRHLVLLYERGQLGDETGDPVGALRGVIYPHGLCFSNDGEYLFVADAGTKNLHLFARAGDSWRGVHFPALTFPVVDEGLFLRRANPREGGPKGIDIERSGRVLAVTGEHQRLRFFDVEHLIAAARPRTADNVAAVDYELAVLTETDARVADAVRKLDVLTNSRSFRLTAPLRSLNREASRFVRRWLRS